MDRLASAFRFASVLMIVPYYDYKENVLSRNILFRRYCYIFTTFLVLIQLISAYNLIFLRNITVYNFDCIVIGIEQLVIFMQSISTVSSVLIKQDEFNDFIQTFSKLKLSLDDGKEHYGLRFKGVYFGSSALYLCHIIILNAIWFYSNGDEQCMYVFQYYSYYVHFVKMLLFFYLIVDIKKLFSSLSNLLEKGFRQHSCHTTDIKFVATLYRKLVMLVKYMNSLFGLHIFLAILLSSIITLDYINMLVFGTLNGSYGEERTPIMWTLVFGLIIVAQVINTMLME